MDTEQHTPGPWTACFSKQCNAVMDFHITAEKDGSLNPVCEYVRPSIKGVDGKIMNAYASPTLEANAHIIAASPDLLEALIWAEMMIDNLRNRRGCGQTEGDDCQKACKAAIAKAQGKHN